MTKPPIDSAMEKGFAEVVQLFNLPNKRLCSR